jgi:hypothetical protein
MEGPVARMVRKPVRVSFAIDKLRVGGPEASCPMFCDCAWVLLRWLLSRSCVQTIPSAS